MRLLACVSIGLCCGLSDIPKFAGRLFTEAPRLPHDLLVDQLLQLLLAQVVFVLVKVEELLGDWGRCWLVLGVVVRLKVWVLQSFLHSNALNRVECEELLEQVEGQIRCLGE